MKLTAISIPDEAKRHVHPVMTQQGPRVRMEVSGLVIEAHAMRVRSGANVVDIKAVGGAFEVVSQPVDVSHPVNGR